MLSLTRIVFSPYPNKAFSVGFGELPIDVRYQLLIEANVAPVWNNRDPVFPLRRLGPLHASHTSAYAIATITHGLLELYECGDAGVVSKLVIGAITRRWHLEWFTADSRKFMTTCNKVYCGARNSFEK